MTGAVSAGFRGGTKTLLSLVAAVAASSVLVLAPPGSKGSSAAPLTAGIAWPRAERGSLPATLPDGTAYTPAWFVDARTSIGTAPSRDGAFLRLLLRRSDGSLRQLRRLPVRGNPSFTAVTAAGDVAAWAEGDGGLRPQLWAVNLRDGRPPRRVTADMGEARFYLSEYDLVIADGRVRWVAAGGGNEKTEVRSVALTGGAVRVEAQPGTWQLSAWPWMVDGVTSGGGATTLKNLATGGAVAVPADPRAVTNCGPHWCRAVSLTEDGARIDLMRPDGTSRREVAEGPVETVVADVGPLDRFEVFAETGGNADFSGNVRLMIYDIAGRRAVQVSPDAANVGYRGGVLWWSTGTQDVFLRHSLDLRTA
ncbi:hypothetical protein [Actinoplanes sp. NPDC049265]|uniref:hypothetical protein n=1 Tax=Actinoplanes sp. NPDC049265 TaxID=3363902 RepID=UPI00371C66F7